MRPRLLFHLAIILVLFLFGIASSLMGAPPSESQKEQLRNMAARTHQKSMRARNQIRTSRMELFRLYSDYNLDERKVRATLNRIKDAQQELLNIHFESQIEIRNILTEEQFNQFHQKCRNCRFGGGCMGLRDEPFGDNILDKKTIDQIGLTPDQVKKLRELFGPTSEGKRVMERLRRDAEKLCDIYSKYELDKNSARRAIQNIHESQSDLLNINFKNQQALRKILSKEQFEKFNELSKRKFFERPRQMRRGFLRQSFPGRF